MKQEIERRQSLANRLAAYFEARPFQILTHEDLVSVVGENFRSRLSELRTKHGMAIERIDVVKADGTAGYGSYIHRPHALGRDAGAFIQGNVTTGTLFDIHLGAFHR